jgi:hypothetical protein
LPGTNDVDQLVELPSSTLEFPAMTYGDSVHDDQQLRDIQELIAKLKDVNRQLALPRTAMPVVVVDAPLLKGDPADTATAQPA